MVALLFNPRNRDRWFVKKDLDETREEFKKRVYNSYGDWQIEFISDYKKEY